ncbi:hypothetical protein PV08_05016 [Exophiala spinifera]|uniref:RBR-type E3 ubiquitin transferase n=1 Tax=Exophiala spinifera TaxID=91928 RepID=A0A0D1YRD2_9EURO|nr:uncharacterized protein PV08_05016 [Exophiala spinifera]KIW17821.1 hypothetical protein PV08_05016 [Exophiala spinifera]
MLQSITWPFDDDVDFDTADLILRLQLEDVEDIRSRAKGKQRVDADLDDSQLALSLMESNLLSTKRLIADRHMSQSIATAVRIDGPVIAQSMQQEEIAVGDRNLARRMGGMSNVTHANQCGGSSSGEINDKILSKLAGMYMFDDDGDADTGGACLQNTGSNVEEGSSAGESSVQASSRNFMSREIVCEACREPKKQCEVMENECSHAYCKQCLQELFDLSTRDESLFPPRCCKEPIPLDDARIFLTKELLDRFGRARIEFETTNRTYCFRKTCSAFIPSDSIAGDVATCPQCLTETCAICKDGAHYGDCPEDTTLQEILAAATENGWQRCYSCRRLVELEVGCNHMTCRCGAEFCYLCGERWKHCTCPQWNEERLLARANAIVDRDLPHMDVADPIRRNRVADATEMLRTGHNCQHTSWRYIAGSHRCEECFHNLPHYIFECRQCRIRACNRCKRNRL